MGFVHGKDSFFEYNGKNLTGFLDSVSMSRSQDMAETSTMGSQTKSYIPGMADSTLSISGRYDSTAVTGPDAVLNGLIGATVGATFTFGPEGNGAGKVKYQGLAFSTSYAVSAPIGDVVAFTAELQATGTITKSTF